MSDQPVAGTSPIAGAAPASHAAKLFPLERSWKVALVVAIVMMLLALLGVGLTMANKSAAAAYWISLVPIYGVLCVFTARIHSQAGLRSDPALLWRQVFHWIGIGVAVTLDFFVGGTNLVTSEGAGLNALLLLALGCYLAGVHFEWLFVVVGVLLTLTLVVIVEAEQYVWLMFIVGVTALVIIFMLDRWLRPGAAKPAPSSFAKA